MTFKGGNDILSFKNNDNQKNQQEAHFIRPKHMKESTNQIIKRSEQEKGKTTTDTKATDKKETYLTIAVLAFQKCF